ncbi:MAG: restriction endonuclease [bacterium]|nr:restriction endonuclease [bacterium]
MIPGYREMMDPIKSFLQDGKTRNRDEIREFVAQYFKLTPYDMSLTVPSRPEALYSNRADFAIHYLYREGYTERTGRGQYRIKQASQTNSHTTQVNEQKQFQSMKPSIVQKSDQLAQSNKQTTTELTPTEEIGRAFEIVHNALAFELLEFVKKMSPSDFENLVVDLLVKMGYGGNLIDAKKMLGKSGDEGVDGVIKEDHLGLDLIYVQAKRYQDTTIGRPSIQQFAGALIGKKAHKGVFIASSTFTKDAKEYAASIENKIVLIDGEQLVNLMIDFDLGVTVISNYQIKKVDLDYFVKD